MLLLKTLSRQSRNITAAPSFILRYSQIAGTRLLLQAEDLNWPKGVSIAVRAFTASSSIAFPSKKQVQAAAGTESSRDFSSSSSAYGHKSGPRRPSWKYDNYQTKPAPQQVRLSGQDNYYYYLGDFRLQGLLHDRFKAICDPSLLH